MRNTYTFIQSPNSVTVYIAGTAYTASTDHPNYQAILTRLKKGFKKLKTVDKLVDLFDTAKAVRAYVGNDIDISDTGVLTYKNTIIDNTLTSKIVSMLQEGFDIDPMVNFLANLQDNPSYASQQELMLFMEVNEMPITPDGYFLAYKSVKPDYKDAHSGTFDNSIGAICSMSRGAVNDDRNQTCSAGLHFAAKEYAGGFVSGGHLMVLKINPADVVSIPKDYRNQKGRCCKYKVIGEVPMAKSGSDKYTDTAVYNEK